MEAPYTPEEYDEELDKINWVSGIPFFLLHLSCLLVFWVGFSWVALATLIISYTVRMFGITAGFHRYFSHRTYKTSRLFQFLMAFLGTTSAQKGPLWWAAHHRHHHKYADTEKDVHSPVERSLWWSHVGWILSNRFKDTNTKMVKDLKQYPELQFLNNYHLIPPILLAVAMFGLGALLNTLFPSLSTSGLQILIYGFILSTVLLYHGTFTVNSLAHVFGKRRFETDDDSRNNWFISVITLGEGWHNNHHRFPSSERQGFYWWEFDFSHYGLKALSWLRLVWDLRVPPNRVYADGHVFKRPPEVIEHPQDR
ncbi:Delta-9 acyl-phospholipid desaturase [Fodinibius salinus]|uniref:Delta-9 acyl-phospholipid desaturase n=1 Tax=Fodinibius salinus TaxID=860790 RepID=A0A5D3YME4_9BACT|nr:acyl-CoA desaturase [Fodinibius salinus]TYP95326.1 Delta-9 acyl-phospholipid desaturase [Fodinibius salinus]